MNNMVLLILASGKSTRFGGYPKAFCKINGIPNVIRTSSFAKDIFSDIYLAVNCETYKTMNIELEGVQIFPIVTGNGDADSIYKCLLKMKDMHEDDYIVICWGDAVFVDSTPFNEIIKAEDKLDESYIVVGCSLDENPYAWFDIKDDDICNSHFKSNGEQINSGLHDQSIFISKIDILFEYLDYYRRESGLNEEDLNIYNPNKKEIKLLESFTFFYKKAKHFNAKYCEITKNKVYSFNTLSELEKIEKLV